MSKYPLCEKLGIKVYYLQGTPYFYPDDLERILSEAPVVRSNQSYSHVWSLNEYGSDTRTARLICIEEIKKETAEDVLKELIAEYADHKWDIKDFINRAKKVLEGK